MPNEESYLNESLRKIAKGAGIGFTGSFIGMALGYLCIGGFLGMRFSLFGNPLDI